MALPFIVVLCLCGVFCLAPVAFYLAWLAAVNRRPAPTVVGGGWDLAALVAGLSGFLVFGGGLLVAAVQSNARAANRGNWEQVQAAWGQERAVWAAVALGYVGLVAGAVGLGAWARSRTLAVYNIAPEPAEAAVTDALAAAGLAAARHGDVWSAGRPVAAVDEFPGLGHVTVRVLCPDRRAAAEIERGLRARLAAAPGAGSPAAGALSSAAIACFATVVCSSLLVAYFIYLNR